MVSIGFADHGGRVLFTVCVDDRQPPPKTFFDPGKTMKASVIICDSFAECKAFKKIHLNIKIFQCLN